MKTPKRVPLLQKLTSDHHRIFKMADRMFKRKNPCQIQKDEIGAVTCIAVREYGRPMMCCAPCAYLGVNGCSIESSACKVWLCYHLYQRPEHRYLWKRLETLRKLFEKRHLLQYFTPAAITIRIAVASKKENWSEMTTLHGSCSGRAIAARNGANLW